MTVKHELFPWSEVKSLGRGQQLIKRDSVSGRTIAYSYNLHGTFMVVSGRGAPGPLTVICDGDAANMVANCLISGSFD
jgi:hypothetical protein